jgi:hypothetical protein
MSTKNDMENDTDKKMVNIHLDMEYNTYKKKIKKYIFKHMEIILNIFSDEFNENLIKLYILFKKKLLEKNYIKYIDLLIDLCQYINSLEYIDQEEYFYTILKLFNLNLLIDKLKKKGITYENGEEIVDLNKVQLIGNKYIKLINFDILNNNICDCVNLISKENIIVELFLIFVNKQNKHSKKNIIFMSEKLSLDFFMYLSYDEMYKKIVSNISITKNKLLHSMQKYKSEFIKSYDHKTRLLKNLYLDQINIKFILKYKFVKKNKLFAEIIKDIMAINLQFDKIT